MRIICNFVAAVCIIIQEWALYWHFTMFGFLCLREISIYLYLTHMFRAYMWFFTFFYLNEWTNNWNYVIKTKIQKLWTKNHLIAYSDLKAQKTHYGPGRSKLPLRVLRFFTSDITTLSISNTMIHTHIHYKTQVSEC